jgi:tRNA(adenine34) deaminase
MELALVEARQALDLGETPVGAVIVKNGAVIGRGGNRVRTLSDPTAHAEIIAIGAAAETIGFERLLDTTMYVTLEPCPMCAGAIKLARIPRLLYGSHDIQAGACGSYFDILSDPCLNHTVDVTPGILDDECSLLLRSFFRTLRERNKAGKESTDDYNMSD